MPRIRCRYIDCIFLDDGFCSASSVDIDPDEGCLTFTMVGENAVDKEWEEEDIEEIWDVDEVELMPNDEDEEDDEDLWLEEDV